MSSPTALAVGGVLLLSTVFLLVHLTRKRDLPPGPTPIPLLGNIPDLMAVAGANVTPMHVLISRWAKTYGPVIHIHVLSQPLIFLSSPQAVSDLLDKRGAIYSDKPHMIMAGELCGCQNMVAFTPYSGQSKRQRRLLTSAFGVRAIPKYEPLIQRSTLQFLQEMLSGSIGYDRVRTLARRYAGGLTLAVVYGYEPVPLGLQEGGKDPDPFIRLASECVDILQNEVASGGGIWAVDVLPWLQHLPLESIPILSYLPGLSFKRKATVWKAKMEEFVEGPWSFVNTAVKSGSFSPSFCSLLLEEREKDAYKNDDTFTHDLKWTANSMYSASGDTTISLMLSFLLAISMHPECVAIAQKEIDSVTRGARLPTLADKDHLPYISAIFTETLRWSCPVPLCLPHRLMEEDVYEGMRIPQGSLVIGNIWAILRDETMYPDPHAFKPERWFTDKKEEDEDEKRRDPRSYVFGFGRRRCPGALLVESSAWLLIAGTLATFNISREGKEAKWEGGVFRTPAPFEFSMTPRSDAAVGIVRQGVL
ncbi:cytochrome P450 [Mucidula mucida]|nr:cytochrome P450 [Mucidula mucida]